MPHRAGTASFTYDAAGQLATDTDPLTNTTATYSHDALGEVTGISYGTGAAGQTGQIPDGGGWRVYGKDSEHARQVARGKTRGQRARYTCLHSAIDGYSRLAYTEALPDEKARTAIGFVHCARAFFARHARHSHPRLVTDNGACYRAHDFATVLRGAPHQRITPYTPRHNGKVERCNRILAEERALCGRSGWWTTCELGLTPVAG
jgi:YD repeat-containing protein